MSLPAVPMPLDSTTVDPFGLWQAPPAAPEGQAVSFGDLSGAEPEQPAAVWSLAISGGAAGRRSAQEELRRRDARLRAIQQGLDEAGPRLDRLLARRSATGLSFGLEAPGAEPLPQPEQALASILEDWDAGLADSGSTGASFGLGEDLSRLVGIDWNALRQRLEAFLDSLNRQILHFVWVDTSLDGRLAARTTVNWSGDLRTLWQVDLRPEQRVIHQQSLEQAMESRRASLRTILTVSKIAGKIVLAVTTPLGPVQALSLAWQFVNDIIIPLMESNA